MVMENCDHHEKNRNIQTDNIQNSSVRRRMDVYRLGYYS